jgi:hypothetical protein
MYKIKYIFLLTVHKFLAVYFEEAIGFISPTLNVGKIKTLSLYNSIDKNFACNM